MRNSGLVPVLAILAACQPLGSKGFFGGGENTIFTEGGGGGGGGDDSDTSDTNTGDPNGPTLTENKVEMLNSPQIGANIYFEFSVSDPQGDIDGGKLFLDVDEDGTEILSESYDVSSTGSGDDVVLLNDVLYFGVSEIDLEASYSYWVQARDASGNLGSALTGDVPAYVEE